MAAASTGFIFTINTVYTRFRHTRMSLVASLLYSGTAGLIVWMLIHTLFFGICSSPSSSFSGTLNHFPSPGHSLKDTPVATESTGTRTALAAMAANGTENPNPAPTWKVWGPEMKTVFARDHLGAMIVWVLGVPAVSLQIVAHYYYG